MSNTPNYTPYAPTYAERMSKARKGMVDTMEPKSVVSRNVEDAAGIGFGVAVFQGARDKGCKKDPTGATALDFIGITMRDRGVRATSPNAFAQFDSARILRSGPIWVEVDGPVAAGDPVVANVNDRFGNDGAGFTIEGARFETSATAAGQLAVVLLP